MTRDIFLRQLDAIHNQNTWHVSLKSALKGLTTEQAESKNKALKNSIWEIVNHLIFYNALELNRFKGVKHDKKSNLNETTYLNNEEKNWITTVASLNIILQDWKHSIATANEEKITEWAEPISYLMLHNAYHIGQIVYIRKLTGTWNTNLGVDYNF